MTFRTLPGPLRERALGRAGVIALLELVLATRGSSQVILDGKFGTSGALTGPNYSITAGMGAVRGNNLFQSFAQFNLNTGETAGFSGPANIQNILCRVTGGSSSSINGTIRSQIPGANFFLINPSGILFGPNAAVDVSGSFAASSANYLKLADGARFVASLGADDSSLSTAPVSSFGFLGNSPGAITVQQSKLSMGPQQTISLVGGDLAVNGGSLTSPGGQINLVSVKSAGEVPVNPSFLSAAQLSSTFPHPGNIQLQNSAQVDASAAGGGRIVIRGGSLVVDNSRIQANTTGAATGEGIDVAVVNDLTLLDGGQINTLSTRGLGSGGNITLIAGSIRLDGGGLVDQSFNPLTQISAATGDPILGGGGANGGDITIQTGSLSLVNSAQISSASYGGGNAGRIDINATSVELDARFTTPTQINANTQRINRGGNAGDIVINTGTLDLLNGAAVLATTFGSGKAGSININAQQSLGILGGSIITAGTFGSGKGGDVQVTAGTILIDGQNTFSGGPDLLTGIQAVTTSTTSPAPGGSIQVTAGSLDLQHMGSIFTTSYGRGTGGNIDVSAGNLSLDSGSSIRAAGQAAGTAGNITLNSQQAITLNDDSAVSTSAPHSSGGEIDVTAGSEVRLNHSQITGQAGLNGGSIRVSARGLVYLLNSTLTGEADTTGSGFGNGGNLTIGRSFLVLNGSGLISKSSFGNGGNISILTDFFFQSSSLIDASAPFGLPGTVTVTAPQVDLSGSLIGLPGNLLGLETQLRPDCGIRLTGNISSFIVLGRGGLPLAPGGFIPSSGPDNSNAPN